LGGFSPLADNPAFGGSHIIQNSLQFPSIVRVCAAVCLYFHHDFLATPVNDQIRLLAGGGTPKKELSKRIRHSFSSQEVFHNKSFPACPSNWVVVKLLKGSNIEEVVQKPSVADEYPWSFYKSFTDIAEVRRQTAYAENPLQ